ncbi:hypothetical protein MXB_4895, partial [Myxobolus squamalis]
IKQSNEPGIEYSYVRFVYYSPACWPNCEKTIYPVITEKKFDTIGCHSELRTLVVDAYSNKTILAISLLSFNGTYLDGAVYGVSNDKMSLIVLHSATDFNTVAFTGLNVISSLNPSLARFK